NPKYGLAPTSGGKDRVKTKLRIYPSLGFSYVVNFQFRGFSTGNHLDHGSDVRTGKGELLVQSSFKLDTQKLDPLHILLIGEHMGVPILNPDSLPARFCFELDRVAHHIPTFGVYLVDHFRIDNHYPVETGY